MQKARIEINKKSIKLIEASNILKNNTAILTQCLKAVQIEMKQVKEENNNLYYILQLARSKKKKAI